MSKCTTTSDRLFHPYGCLFEGLRFSVALILVAAVLWLSFKTRLTVSPDAALKTGEALTEAYRQVLVVAAHPDDVEWYISGTLARLADAGAGIHVVMASYGEKGPNRTGVSDLPATRREEQLEAGRRVGYSDIHFLGLPDREVSEGHALRENLEELWNRLEPDLVLTFDPDTPSLPYLHPDHQGTGGIVQQVWRNKGKSPPDLYLWQTRRPDTLVDITAVIDRKVLALSAHASQGLEGAAGRVRGFNQRAGNLAGVTYAEGLRRAR